MRWPAWRYLFGLYRRTPELLAASVLAAAGQSALLVATAPLMRRIFDGAIPAGDTARLRELCALLLLLVGASAALAFFVRVATGRMGKRAIETLRGDLLWRLLALPREQYVDGDYSALHAMITSDTERIDVLGYSVLAQLIPGALVGLVLAGVLLALNPFLFGVLCLTFPVTVLLARVLAARMTPLAQRYHDDFTALSRNTMLVVQRRDALQSYSVDPVIQDRQTGIAASLRSLGERWMHASSLYQFANQLGMAVAVVVLLLVGGELVIRGRLTLGEMAGFFLMAILLRDQLSLALGAIPQIISGRAALARTHGWIERTSADVYQKGRLHVAGPKRLSLDAVSFSYGKRAVLRAASLNFTRGRIVAVGGASGIGKTTMALLLLGLYRPAAGRVQVDGIAYDQVDLPKLRAHIGYVPQHPMLFDATIAENIRFWRSDITEEAIETAQRLAGLGDFVASLPAGRHTRVGEEGLLLSGGQRQRIALARALAARPAFLILDEPTAHLDAEATRAVFRTLRALPWAPGILLITHDDDLDVAVDEIYQLERGVVNPVTASRMPTAA